MRREGLGLARYQTEEMYLGVLSPSLKSLPVPLTVDGVTGK